MGKFERDKPGERLDFGGICLVYPPDRLPPGKYPFAQNVRRYWKGGIIGRNLLTAAIYTLAAVAHSIRRFNDSTPSGPPSGYTIINGASTTLSVWNSTIGVVNVATGLSGNPLSIVPFRPNASVQPWAYVANSAAQGSVTLATKYLINGTTVDSVSNGMMKVRSDGLCYKEGVKEPQLAPVVSTQNSSVPFGGVGSMLATAIPWTNYSSANSGFDYGETEGYPNVTPPVDGTAPFLINCENATYITITALSRDGTVVINGATNPTLTATSSGRVRFGAPGYPGQFIQISGSRRRRHCVLCCRAFTDGAGNVIPAGVAPLFVPNIVDVGVAFGTSTNIKVPYGAVAFQVGVNSVGNNTSQEVRQTLV